MYNGTRGLSRGGGRDGAESERNLLRSELLNRELGSTYSHLPRELASDLSPQSLKREALLQRERRCERRLEECHHAVQRMSSPTRSLRSSHAHSSTSHSRYLEDNASGGYKRWKERIDRLHHDITAVAGSSRRSLTHMSSPASTVPIEIGARSPFTLRKLSDSPAPPHRTSPPSPEVQPTRYASRSLPPEFAGRHTPSSYHSLDRLSSHSLSPSMQARLLGDLRKEQRQRAALRERLRDELEEKEALVSKATSSNRCPSEDGAPHANGGWHPPQTSTASRGVSKADLERLKERNKRWQEEKAKEESLQKLHQRNSGWVPRLTTITAAKEQGRRGSVEDAIPQPREITPEPLPSPREARKAAMDDDLQPSAFPTAERSTFASAGTPLDFTFIRKEDDSDHDEYDDMREQTFYTATPKTPPATEPPDTPRAWKVEASCIRSSGTKHVSFEVPPSCPFKGVKQCLETLVGVPEERQRLLVSNQAVDDSMQLTTLAPANGVLFTSPEGSTTLRVTMIETVATSPSGEEFSDPGMPMKERHATLPQLKDETDGTHSRTAEAERSPHIERLFSCHLSETQGSSEEKVTPELAPADDKAYLSDSDNVHTVPQYRRSATRESHTREEYRPAVSPPHWGSGLPEFSPVSPSASIRSLCLVEAGSSTWEGTMQIDKVTVSIRWCGLTLESQSRDTLVYRGYQTLSCSSPVATSLFRIIRSSVNVPLTVELSTQAEQGSSATVEAQTTNGCHLQLYIPASCPFRLQGSVLRLADYPLPQLQWAVVELRPRVGCDEEFVPDLPNMEAKETWRSRLVAMPDRLLLFTMTHNEPFIIMAFLALIITVVLHYFTMAIKDDEITEAGAGGTVSLEWIGALLGVVAEWGSTLFLEPLWFLYENVVLTVAAFVSGTVMYLAAMNMRVTLAVLQFLLNSVGFPAYRLTAIFLHYLLRFVGITCRQIGIGILAATDLRRGGGGGGGGGGGDPD